MSSLSRYPREVICPSCGFINRPSFRVCHGCTLPLGPKERPASKACRVALRPSSRNASARVTVVGNQLILLVVMVLLAVFTKTRPQAAPTDAVIPVEPAASATVAERLTRIMIEPALKELAATIDPAPGISVSHPSTRTVSARPSRPSSQVAYTTPMTLSFLSGPNVLVPPSPGRDGSLSATGPPPAQADVIQPTYSRVITYSVRRGDTLFKVAEKFGLMPHTVYWSNLETLARNPDRLNVGSVLNILPVNGVYHIVSDGDTIADLAQKYGVETSALSNVWNDLAEGQSLTAGTALVIPGGNGGSAPWPLEETSIGGNNSKDPNEAALCGAELSGEPGRRWFDWPTEERKISGWYFRDARNPAHAGIDIDLNTGDPVRAADGGVISFGGWWVYGGYGNLVVVDHLNGWETWYAHLSKVNVTCGQQVRAGDIIGLGGSTGWSTGPHLHFEMRLAGLPRNPLEYLP